MWHDRRVLSAVSIVVRVAAELFIVGWVALAFRSRQSLQAEVLFLRRQLALYVERGVKPRRIDAATRVSLAENLRHRLMDAEAAGLVAVSQTQELQNQLAATDNLLRQERARGQEQRRQTVEAVAQEIATSWRRAYVIIAVIAALVAGGVTWIAVSLPDTIAAKVASVMSALFITGVGFWRVPDLFIEPRLARWFARKFESEMHRLQVSGVENEFDVDLKQGHVAPKETQLQ